MVKKLLLNIFLLPLFLLITWNGLGQCDPSPTITLESDATDHTICSGQPVTFTATVQNSGTNPLYQWRINGVNSGSITSNNYFTTTNLKNGDVVSVALTSDCTTTPISSSNLATTVNPIPSAPSAGNGGEVCIGGQIALTASSISGATYEWSGPNG